MSRGAVLIDLLGLQPHPEGGHYRETFRSPMRQSGPRGERAASTAIWFLLQAGQVSRWHRVEADECWHWYEGQPLAVLVCEQPGAPVTIHQLGPVDAHSRPQHVVPAGWWQAAMPLGDYALVGCTVAPGFDFADFTLIDPASRAADWFRAHADPRLVALPG